MRKRYIQIGGELIPYEDCIHPEPSGPYVMPDIQPYKSMIDGSIISSRSTHRTHLREHGCIEVGNETKYITKHKPIETPEGLKETLVRIVEKYR